MNSFRVARVRLAAVAAGMALAVVACGSSGSSEDAAVAGASGAAQTTESNDASATTQTTIADEAAEPPSDLGQEEPEDSESEDAESGVGGATLTLDDGTELKLQAVHCETSDTNPSRSDIANGFAFSGTTADGAFNLSYREGNVASEGSHNRTSVGGLGGDLNEAGFNPQIYYHLKSSLDQNNIPLYDTAVEGGHVLATYILVSDSDSLPFGAEIGATLEVDCS